MSNKSNGKKEVGILVGVVLAGIAIFVVTQIFMNSVEDGGFSKNVPTITYEELFEKINNGDDFILIYGADSCSACSAYKPTVGSVLKDSEYNDIDVYYIDIDSLNETDRAALANYLGATSTPISYMFVGGMSNESLEGAADKQATEKFYDLFKSYTSEK